MASELQAYKSKSQIDDVLRVFGDKIEITIEGDIFDDEYYAIRIKPTGLEEKAKKISKHYNNKEILNIMTQYQIDVDLDTYRTSQIQALVKHVDMMLKAYNNSLFAKAETENELLNNDMTNEYYYITEEEVLILNDNLQIVGTATKDEIKYNEHNIKCSSYTTIKYYTYNQNTKFWML